MKLHDLLVEGRKSNWKYTEKRVKGALTKVILELEGSDSGAATRLAKRYERLDKSAKLIKEKRDELNTAIKDLGDQIFDVEDALASRIIETVSYTVLLTAGEKAETKSATPRTDFEAAYAELALLVPELDEKAKEILAKYTEMIPPKDSPTGLRVKSKVAEGLFVSVKSIWNQLMSSIRKWGSSYDNKLNAIKKKYTVKGTKNRATL